MKFTLSWLKTHLDTSASLTEICDKLTALGLEVESVDDPAKKLAPFIVAHVLTAEQHPNADRLKVTTVDTGKEKLQVVCGAPNCRAGLKVVLARPGDVMPDTNQALKKGVIRGVESNGMLCAADELCLQDEETSGIIELPLDAPVGENYAQYAGLNDPVIEIKLTPNRPDCTGVRGIARDLAAAGMGTLKPLSTKAVTGAEASTIKVVLDFPANNMACPHFVGRLIRNVKNGESPEWLKRRLTSIGLRPISALVDMTNFMTMDCGRPLHVFDAKKIKGNLRVYPAKGGEKLLALNGKEYTLSAGMAVIGDDTGVLSLGGIMGGETSSCDATTTDVFVEAAFFDAVATARTGRALQINSDARYRFERGIDPAFTEPGMELATQMIIDLCGTPETVVSRLEIAGTAPVATKAILLDPAKCEKHTGVKSDKAEQTTILQKLGFTVTASGEKLSVTVPTWRPDVEGAEDLVEEVVRVRGYDIITATSLPRPLAARSALDLTDQRSHAVRHALAAQGLMESITWSFMPLALAEKFGGGQADLRLINPISTDLDCMRPSIVANLAEAARRNADRGFSNVALFEVGATFANAKPEGQKLVATTLRAGHTQRHWAEPSRAVDAYDAKADALAALAAIGAPTASLQITTDAPSYYHPGRSGSLRLGPTQLAVFGELHPSLLADMGIDFPVVAAEIYVDAPPASRNSGTAKPLLKLEPLQPLQRDFAFLVGRDVIAAKIIKAVRDADKVMIRDAQVFDVYQGNKVDADKKSVAISVTLQPTDKTLTDAEIEAIANKITASVTKATGAVLRG